MKNHSMRKMLFRSIRGGVARFLSIFAIVALGCGFLVGLFSTCPDMQDTADAYYRQYHTMDLNIKGTAGLTQEDIEQLRLLPGVESVQAGYSYDLVLLDPNGDEVTARTWGFSEDPETRCNGFSLTEGRLPQNASECVLEVPNAYTGSYALGDLFAVAPGAPDGFVPRRLTVVGLAKSPLYMSIEQEPTNVGTGKIGVVLYLSPEAFSLPVYTDALLIFSETRSVSCFSDPYRDLLTEKRVLCETLGADRSLVRLAELRAQYSDALERAENALAEATTEWQKERAATEKTLSALFASASLQETLLLRETAQSIRRYGTEKNFPESVRTKLAAMQEVLTARQNAYRNALLEAELQREMTESALEQARAELKAQETAFAELTEPHWVLFDRTENAGYASFSSNSEKIASISLIFPIFFCLVAALVATTTMTRMVEEERVRTGTLGALGYGRRSILGYYLLYCLCACVPGCVLGIVIGSGLFPSVIWNAYSLMYALPPLQTPLRWGYALAVLLSVCGVILTVTLAVCHTALQEMPASLMRPRAPASGKRILLERFTRLWRKLSFQHKVTARNLFRYKKRLLMTVVGVAGCTALLLTGFGLRDSIGSVVDRQYERVQTYQLSVLLNEGVGFADDPILNEFLSEPDAEGVLPLCANTVTLENEGVHLSVSLYVPAEGMEIEPFLSLHTADKQRPLSVKEGIVLTEKASQVLGVSAGEQLGVTLADGSKAYFPVSGVCENYISNFACVSSEQYRLAFDREAAPNTLFVKLREDTAEVRDAIAIRLYQSENVRYLHFNGEVRETFSGMIEKLNFVVYVLIFSAGALALIVLYNLNTINICERKRELATMKVLGLFEREILQYVFRETVLLTLFGAVCGLGLGVLLHGFVIRTVEMEILMFGHDISMGSFVLSALLTLLFSLLVGLLSMPTLQKIDMVDSLKANE